MLVNKKIISRFSQYREVLLKFQEMGLSKIFSNVLGDAVGVTSAQVRKDFSLHGISGNKRGGYQIEDLLHELRSILGKDKVHHVVVVGIGNLGRALIQYTGFDKEGIQIVAGFDIDPAKVNKRNRIPVYHLDELNKYVCENQIQIGVLAVPDAAAQSVCNIMVDSDIKGILNFAQIRLIAPEDVVINSVFLQMELENVIYFVNAMENKCTRCRSS
ncbi:redox-sensing transcriptional repressor Rex [candidate division KSB1 bacterium]|nr:redox-sensing transcriptional repressor Rex [candidate division KSB1 bacterium]